MLRCGITGGALLLGAATSLAGCITWGVPPDKRGPPEAQAGDADEDGGDPGGGGDGGDADTTPLCNDGIVDAGEACDDGDGAGDGCADCVIESGYTCSQSPSSCSCETGLQDNDETGGCQANCATAALSCGHGSCSDEDGSAGCACDTGWQGAACDACAPGYHDVGGICAPTCATAPAPFCAPEHCDDSAIPTTCDSGGECVVFVDAGAPPGGDGSTWASAANDLQAALAQAAALMIGPPPCAVTFVWVAEGSYELGGAGETFEVVSGVRLLGGFAGTEATDEPTGARPVLDGNGTAHHVITAHTNTSVHGVTIRGGQADGIAAEDRVGGGALIEGLVNFFDCVFEDNEASDDGAALAAYDAVLGLNGVQVRDSTGSAIYLESSYAGLSNKSLMQGTVLGVAVVAVDTNLTLDKAYVINNSTGGVRIEGTSTVAIREAIFAGNSSSQGVIHLLGGDLEVSNSLLLGNSGPAILVEAGEASVHHATFKDSISYIQILAGATFSGSGLVLSPTGGVAVIDADSPIDMGSSLVDRDELSPMPAQLDFDSAEHIEPSSWTDVLAAPLATGTLTYVDFDEQRQAYRYTGITPDASWVGRPVRFDGLWNVVVAAEAPYLWTHGGCLSTCAASIESFAPKNDASPAVDHGGGAAPLGDFYGTIRACSPPTGLEGDDTSCDDIGAVELLP